MSDPPPPLPPDNSNGQVKEEKKKKKGKKKGKGASALNSKAYSAVYKVMNDPIAQRHTTLQQYCMAALGQEVKNNKDFDMFDVDPITDICLINVAKGEKVPDTYEALKKTVGGKPAHVLKGTGGRYLLCYKRARIIPPKRSRSGSVSDADALMLKAAVESAAQTSSSPSTPRGTRSSGFQPSASLTSSDSASDLLSVDSSGLYNPPSTRGKAIERETRVFARSAISDVRITRVNEIPHGYKALKKTYWGKTIFTSFVVCYARTGRSQVKHLALIHPTKQEKAPAGYLCVKENLNEGVNTEGDETFLCYAKDISGHFKELLKKPPSGVKVAAKYLPPLLATCHIVEPVLGTVALLSLQSLVISGFFNTGDDRYSQRLVSSVISSVCDALNTTYEPNFQKELLQLLRMVLKSHYNLLSLDDIFDMAVAAFRVVSTSARNVFLESFVDICVKAPGSDAFTGINVEHKTPEDFARSIVSQIAGNICHDALSSRFLHIFNVSSLHNPMFRDEGFNVIRMLFNKTAHRRLGVLMLVLCKMSKESEVATAKMRYKYGLARKHSALFILQRLLVLMDPNVNDKSPLAIAGPGSAATNGAAASSSSGMNGGGRLRVSPSMSRAVRIPLDRNFAFLLRRFLFTGLCHMLGPEYSPDNTPVHIEGRTFKHVLAIFTLVWGHFPHLFPLELGVMLDDFLLFVAEHNFTSVERRTEVLQTLSEVFHDDPQNLMNLYYNYDNLRNWNIFERLIEVLGKVAEDARPKPGDKGGIRKASQAVDEKTADARVRGVTVEFDASIQDLDPTSPKSKAIGNIIGSVSGRKRLSPQQALELSCMELVVAILRNADSWHEQKFREKRMRLMAAQRGLDTVPENKSPTGTRMVHAMSQEEYDLVKKEVKNSRKGTVMHRFHKQQSDKKILEKALRIARQKSLAKAIAHLASLNYLQQDAEEISDFLHRHGPRLELEIVGEYLGGKAPRKEDPFTHEVRCHYIRRLNVENMPMQEALRRFLTESGFRLPKEAQKIERLLESFADVYCDENPAVFDDPDAAFVMANAILMLNTSLHNPNLKDSDRITKAQFLIICEGVTGAHYTDDELETLYDEILHNGYRIELTENIKKLQRSKDSAADEKSIHDKAADNYARACKLRARHAVTELKLGAKQAPLFYQATSDGVVVTMLELTWYQYMSVISATLESTVDTRMVALCLDGFKYAFRLCTRLGMRVERNALGASLARFTFMYKNALSANPLPSIDVTRALVTGRHMKQVWLEVLNGLPEHDPKSVQTVSEVLDDIKREYMRETNYKVLREIQSRITGDVNVVRPGRYFIREGNLKKVSANGDQRNYRMFLFSDALMYTQQQAANKFDPHRVLLLAFMKIVPVKGKGSLRYGFHVLSPQKSVTLYAENSSSRDAWMDALQKGIDKQRGLRDEIIKVANECALQGRGGITQADVLLLERTASFLNRDPELIPRGLIDSKDGDNEESCPLCMREYTFFNGKQRCRSCNEFVCGKCVVHKVEVANNKKVKVCDGCYGLTDDYKTDERRYEAELLKSKKKK